MIEYFLVWFTAIITFVFGYLLGRGKETVTQIQEVVKDAKKKLSIEPVGPVIRPSAQTLYKTHNPEGRKIAEEEEAMRETFTKGIPEI